jgi:hypothetical protein
MMKSPGSIEPPSLARTSLPPDNRSDPIGKERLQSGIHHSNRAPPAG